ncbi:DUF6082 family protein [Streptomyces sp. NPDC055243]|uniref:DUF6082 family protein n=1 Tax=Streptomyces sp. NPDC055243 TaxID=3365720 RepID=UPI0037CDAC43
MRAWRSAGCGQTKRSPRRAGCDELFRRNQLPDSSVYGHGGGSMTVLSLIISAAALVGVAMSLIYQSRQTRLSREENMRASHRELLVMSINDEILRPCWGSPLSELPEVVARQMLFSNLIVSWWHSAYMIKETTDQQVSLLFRHFFEGEISRAYWDRARAGWSELAHAGNSSKTKRFVSLADEEYRAVVSAGA